MSDTKKLAERDILVRNGTTPTNGNGDGDGDGDAKAVALRADIDKTRSEMSGTIRQIEERLSPAHLKEQVLEQLHDAKEKVKSEVRVELQGAKEMVRNEIAEAKHAVRDATIGRVEHMVDSAKTSISEGGHSIVDTIRANPIPALLAGVGLTWLFMSARRGGSSSERGFTSRRRGNVIYTPRGYSSDYERDEQGMLEHGREAVGQAMHRAGDAASSAARTVRDAAGNLVDQAGDAVSGAGERIGTMAHQASDRAGELAHRVGDGASHLAHDARDRAVDFGHQARDRAMELEGRAETVYRDNPLAVGAAAFALGTVVGLSLPHTQREDALMGATRDRLLDKATHMAGDAVGAAKEKAQGLVQDIGATKNGKAGGAQAGEAGSDKTSRV